MINRCIRKTILSKNGLSQPKLLSIFYDNIYLYCWKHCLYNTKNNMRKNIKSPRTFFNYKKNIEVTITDIFCFSM